MAEARIEIRGLRVEARIGVTDAELELERPLLIDLVLTVADCGAVETDEISDTADYAAAAARAAEIAGSKPHRTLEHLAGKIAAALAAALGVAVEATVAKPDPPMAETVDAVSVRVSASAPE